MKTLPLAAIAASLLCAASAARADDLVSGVYATSPDLCERARSSPDGLQAVFEDGNVVLTAQGILGIEYHCEFLQTLRAARSPGAVVIALCEEPGFAFPDTIAIMPRGEGELELTASSGGSDEEGNISGNSGLFHLCEGVSPP